MSNFTQQDKLLEWLKSGQCIFNTISLKEVEPEYRVVMAKQTIPKDEIIIQIPLTHIITTEKAKTSNIFHISSKIDNLSTEIVEDKSCQIDTSNIELPTSKEIKLINVRSNHTFLALFLLNEKRNPESFWQPYIKSLPETYSNMPVNFTNNELSYLEGSFTVDKINNFHNDLKLEYYNILQQKPELKEWFLYKDWVWAKIVVITRVFSLIINGVKTEGLVPLIDMCNHNLKSETIWKFEDSLNSFVLCSKEKIWSGEEIFDSYGKKCNSRFFVNYGFTLLNNQEDNRARLRIIMDKDCIDDAKQHKINMLGEQDKLMLVCLQHQEKDTVELFSLLRILCGNKLELGKILLQQEKKEYSFNEIPPVSVRNEEEVLKLLSKICERTLKEFPTSIADDKQLLSKSKNLTNNIRNCIVMRLSEKEVLKSYITLNKMCEPLFELYRKKASPKKIYTSINQVKLNIKYLESYFNIVVSPLLENKQ
jgi:histone-lysine N-methyltransferase SETD3